MSGTRSPSPKAPATDPGTEPATEGRWPVWKLAALFYPFAAAAVAINLFLAGLILHGIGGPAIPPITALIWSLPLGVPATWACGAWVRGLMDRADG